MRARSRLFGLEAVLGFGYIPGGVDLDSDAGVTVALQIVLA
jgi:hypothetical protein